MADNFCSCGCGEIAKKGNRFVHGHNARSEHPMQGKKHSPETIQKLISSHLGLPSFRKGTTCSEESKRKMSEAHKGVPLSASHRKKLGLVSKNRWASKADEERIEWHRKIGESQKGKIISPEAIAKMIKSKKGKRCSRGTEFTSEKLKARYLNPEYVAKMRKAWNIKPNKAEVLMLKLLEDLYPGEWKYTGDFSFTINGKCPDFVNCNGQKKIIEYFGDHWHIGHSAEDRAEAFRPFGYETLVIWGHEMKNMEAVIDRIHEFCLGGHK